MFIINAFEQGGVFMYFILVFFILTLAFIWERYSALYLKLKSTPVDFRQQVLNFIQRNDLLGAAQFAAKHNQTSLGRVIEVGCSLRAKGAPDEELQARMDEQLNEEIASIDRRSGFLAMFGNVATLVGLLGTIGGMVIAFAGVADANPADRATLLSSGISHALNCTAFGLLTAIPALVAYAVFQNKTDRIVGAISMGTSEIYHDLLFLTEADIGVSNTKERAQMAAKAASSASSPEVSV